MRSNRKLQVKGLKGIKIMKLSKQEMMRKLSAKSGLTQIDCRKIFDALGEIAREEIINGNEVTVLQGLCVRGDRKESYRWENPLIGGWQDIPSHITPKARFSDQFKQQLRDMR